MKPEALQTEAANWFARLADPGASPEEGARWQAWLSRSPAHAEAWQQVEAVCGQLTELAGLPGPLAHRTLQALNARTAMRRRQLLRGGSAALGLLGLGVLSWPRHEAGDDAPWQTAWAERRAWPLPEGGRLWLQARSAAELRPGATGMELHLHRGELLIEGPPLDTDAKSSPTLRLPTGQRLRAQAPGSRYSLLLGRAGRASQLHVFAGAVAVDGEAHPVPVGQALALPTQPGGRPHALGPAQRLREGWVQGRLIAEALHLDALLDELMACHPGRIDCSEDLAGLRVVGSLPLYELGAALDTLAAILPLEVQRLLPGWTRLRPRPAS